MAYRLKQALYRARCRQPGCPFVSELAVKENLMGATKADIDSEAWKIAKNLAVTQHDAIYGTKHPMRDPDIHKIRSVYEPIGSDALAAAGRASRPGELVHVRRFERGDRIIAKGERATTVCEVMRGSAYNELRPTIRYRPGATFGAAGLFEHKQRMANIIAGENDTLIGFYDMRELHQKDPAKARELYNEAMEDIFRVLAYYEDYSASLEKKLAKLKTEPSPRKRTAKKAARAR